MSTITKLLRALRPELHYDTKFAPRAYLPKCELYANRRILERVNAPVAIHSDGNSGTMPFKRSWGGGHAVPAVELGPVDAVGPSA